MIELLRTYIMEPSNFVFMATALFGTTLFILRLCVSMIGGFGDELVEGSDELHHHAGSFKLFTLHSVSGFFMMFGWVGLACTQELGYNHYTSILAALLAGSITMVLTALIFKWSQLLASPGTRFEIEDTIGLVGTVYHRISANDPGKIQLVVEGVTRELLALSYDGSSIESFQFVVVVKIMDHETVMVQQV